MAAEPLVIMVVGDARQGKSVSAVLSSAPESASKARSALRRFRSLLEESRFLDLQLVVSELVAEPLHTGEGRQASIEVEAEIRGGSIHVEVTVDDDAVFRLPSRQAGPCTPGWGLHLMSRLADRWGVRRDGRAAGAWFEIAARSVD